MLFKLRMRSCDDAGDACAFLELVSAASGPVRFGVGMGTHIVTASVKALLSGVNRLKSAYAGMRMYGHFYLQGNRSGFMQVSTKLALSPSRNSASSYKFDINVARVCSVAMKLPDATLHRRFK